MNKKISTSLVASLLLATNIYANDTIQLDEIIVTSATKSAQSIKDVTSNIDVITSEEIEERHFTTVTEALNTISGISFTSNGGLGKASSVRVRGFDTKRVLVLVDGIRYNDLTSTSGAQFENIMINNIEKIEVIKGAQSGIWGADASAGVINIITKNTNNGFHGNINTEYGSYNTKKYGLNLSYRTSDYYLEGFYNKLDTDGFTAYSARGTNLDDYEDDGYENENYGFKTGLNFDDNNKIKLSHSISDSKNDYDDFGADNSTNYSTSRTKNSQVSFENINSITKSNIYFNRTDFDRKYYESSSYGYKGTVDEYGINTNLKYLNDTSFLVIGVDYKNFKENDSITKNYSNKGIFLTNSNNFGSTIFTQSLRYDNYDAFDNKATGKLGIKHNLTKDLYLSSNYGTAYNVPTLNQLYGAFGANPNLNSETTKSFDASVGYKGLELTYFHNKITDMIDWNSGYDNIDGTSVLKGFEVNYKKNINTDTLMTLGFTKLSAKNSDKEYLARRADKTFKFGLDYYGFNNFHINLNGEYIGSRYNSDNKAGEQTGKYTVWNSVVNYKINKTFSTYLKVDNLFNKYYQTVDGYATAERSAYIGLKATF